MGVYSMLTDKGLNEIVSAQPDVGILIEVNHWVASFDEQLDADYESGSDNYKDITNYTSPLDTFPDGNPIYWNTGNSDRSSFQGDWSSTTPPTDSDAVGGTILQYDWWNVTITGNIGGISFVPGDSLFWNGNSWQNGFSITPQKDDLFTGVSYSPVVDDIVSPERYIGSWDWNGTDELPQNPGTGDWWDITVANTVGGIFYDIGNALLWNGVAWQNGVDTNGRGKFRVIVSNPNESMTINKIGIYGSKRSVDGVIQGLPFLLGEVIIPAKQLIQPKASSDDSFSVDQLVVDFEIDIQAIIVNFDDIIYASPNDYWDRIVSNDGQYGLATDGQVYISNRVGIEDLNTQFPNNNSSEIPIGDIGVGKLLVATYQTVNKFNPHEEEELPQLVLQYVNTDNYDGINGGGYIGNGFAPRIRTTFRTNPQGNCEIDLYGSCANEYGYYALIPKEDRIFGLGNDDNRWNILKLSNRFELYLGDKPKDDDGNVNTNTTKFGYIVFDKNPFNNYDTGLAYFGNSSIAVGPHQNIDPNIEHTNLDNYSYTYGNISNFPSRDPYSGEDDRAYDLAVRSTHDIVMYNLGNDYVSDREFGRGIGDDSQTTIYEIWNMLINGQRDVTSSDYDESAFINKVVIGDNGNPSIFKKFFSESAWNNLNNGSSITSLVDMRNAIYGQDEITDITKRGNGINKDTLITSSRYIFTNGDILPMVNGLNNLGSYHSRFRDLYIDTIHGAKHSSGRKINDVYGDPYNGWNLLYMDADIVPENSSKKITYNLKGERFDVITCDDLGYDNLPIDAGYISKLKISTDITMKSGSNIKFENGWSMDRSSLINCNGGGYIGSSDCKIEEIWVKAIYADEIYGSLAKNKVSKSFSAGNFTSNGNQTWMKTSDNNLSASYKIEWDGVSDNARVYFKIKSFYGSDTDDGDTSCNVDGTRWGVDSKVDPNNNLGKLSSYDIIRNFESNMNVDEIKYDSLNNSSGSIQEYNLNVAKFGKDRCYYHVGDGDTVLSFTYNSGYLDFNGGSLDKKIDNPNGSNKNYIGVNGDIILSFDITGFEEKDDIDYSWSR